MTEVKLCGTASRFDLNVAQAVGANAVGIICRPYDALSCPANSQVSHTVDVATAIDLVDAADAGLTTVLLPRLKPDKRNGTLLQDARKEYLSGVLALAGGIKPDRLQLGETEDPRLTEALYMMPERPEIAQVIHVDEHTKPEVVDAFVNSVDIIHLDSAGALPGGNGRPHDWAISREIADRAHATGKRVILAGGLNALNVGEAIAVVQPDGVDVESAIKSAFGRHNHRRARDFVQAAQAAFEGEEMLK